MLTGSILESLKVSFYKVKNGRLKQSFPCRSIAVLADLKSRFCILFCGNCGRKDCELHVFSTNYERKDCGLSCIARNCRTKDYVLKSKYFDSALICSAENSSTIICLLGKARKMNTSNNYATFILLV